MSEINIIVDHFSTEVFSLVLQNGFQVKAMTGLSIKDLLVSQLGISPEYIEKNITTIFLDGKPVDDLDSSIVHGGTVLSLSAAMPGLVGATMRRGGYYSSLRSNISYQETGGIKNDDSVHVNLKLFNTIKADLGQFFFEMGIYLTLPDFNELYTSHSGFFRNHTTAFTADGEIIDHDTLNYRLWEAPSERVLLKYKPQLIL